MRHGLDRGTGRAATVAALVTLALVGCSSGGDDDGGGVPVAATPTAPVTGTPLGTGTPSATGTGAPAGGGVTLGGGALGTIAGNAQPLDDDGTAEIEGVGTPIPNPFGAAGGGGGQPLGGATGAGPGTAGPGTGGGLPFGGGVDVVDDQPTPTPVGGAVLERLQNGFAGEDLTDVWICSAPQVPDVQAVGYVFARDFGALLLAPADGGDPVSAVASVAESPAGTVVNTYQDGGPVETMTDFAFSGTGAFSADSTLVGTLGCQRFFVAGAGTGGGPATGGPPGGTIGGGPVAGGPGVGGGQAVSASLQNDLTADGRPATVWACRGPQASAETVGYGFYAGGSGLYVAQNAGQTPQGGEYQYVESAPGTIQLTYGNGFAETLSGFVFSSATQFDMTSSDEGPLSCGPADLG